MNLFPFMTAKVDAAADLAEAASATTDKSIPVVQHGLSIGGAGSWGLLGVVLVTLIKVWPVINLQIIKAREILRGERRDEMQQLRDDLNSLRDTVTDVNHKLVAAEAKAAASDVRTGQFEFALRITMDEIERRLPDSPVPAQVRAMLAGSMPKPTPSGIDQADMDMIRKAERHD